MLLFNPATQMKSIAFFDIETSVQAAAIFDIGAIRTDEAKFHKNSMQEFVEFIKGTQFLCGHNIVQHDLKLLQKRNRFFFHQQMQSTHCFFLLYCFLKSHITG